MSFASPGFLFAVLPGSLAGAFLLRGWTRHFFLLTVSVAFAAWSDPWSLPFLGGAVLLCRMIGPSLQRHRDSRRGALLHATSVAGVLLGFVLLRLAPRAGQVLPEFAGTEMWLHPHMPLGLAFFSLMAVTYLSDVRRGAAPASRSTADLALYLSFFPQLLAGPVTRYAAFASQIAARSAPSAEDLEAGAKRFIAGLAKKVLLADRLSPVADAAFGAHGLTPTAAWVGVLAFTLQLAFDFSGYSDMAIGLARMLGFRLAENFSLPYLAASVGEFWRKWHMSLMKWFRDEVYIPLGGSRRSAVRVTCNILAVFVLSGLWHGPEWHFIVWGLLMGTLVSAERAMGGSLFGSAPRWLKVAGTQLLLLCGWVFFRATTVLAALNYFAAMVGLSQDTIDIGAVQAVINPGTLRILALALSVSAILGLRGHPSAPPRPSLAQDLWSIALLVTSLAVVAATLARPFLYGHF